MTELCSLLKE